MIGTQLYKGQGLGNQLWTYAVTRSIAIKNGYKFSILGRDNFKGSKTFNLDFGENSRIELAEFPLYRVPTGFTQYYAEKKIMHPILQCDISTFDSDLYNVADGTFIDGNMQTEKYLIHNKKEILEWLKVPGYYFDGCTIHFRGTEYRGLKEVLVPKAYYQNALNYLTDKYGQLDFRVVTDDIELAREYFPSFLIIGRNSFMSFLDPKLQPFKNRLSLGPNQAGIRRDFGFLQNSKYLIIPNSSFSWWGAWTNQVAQEVIAPKYWARHNISNGFWSTGDILTESWNYLDRNGNFFSYEECAAENQNRI
jgi:hypothetical protein